jgi:hypothetical protein
MNKIWWKDVKHTFFLKQITTHSTTTTTTTG